MEKNCPHFLELKGSLQVKALVQLFKLETALPTPPRPLHKKMSSLSADYSVKGDSGVIKPGSAEGGQDVAQKSKENNGVTAFINLARVYLPSPPPASTVT